LLFNTKGIAEIVDQTKDALGFPKAAEEQKENLSLPDSIYVVPLKLEIAEPVSTMEWYKGLYYYQTFRLNQGDFLFHYFVTKDGEILQGNSKGEEQRLALKGEQAKPVIVGYLSDKEEEDFSVSGRKALNELLVDVANRNRIKLENIQVKKLEYQVTEEQQIVGVTDIIAGRWDRSMKDMIKEITDQYDPAKFKFDLEVTMAKAPEAAANYGDQVIADITVKNNSTVSLYEGSDFEPIMTKVGDDFSKFFINTIWLGPKQTKIMPEGASLRPGESKTFQIKLGVPLFFDKQTEKFELVSLTGDKYEKTTFELSLNVNRTDKDAVEIVSTPVGYLNVREQPNTSSKVVTKVSPGQRFLVLERQGSGWVKIDAGVNGQGWVSTQYTKKL